MSQSNTNPSTPAPPSACPLSSSSSTNNNNNNNNNNNKNSNTTTTNNTNNNTIGAGSGNVLKGEMDKIRAHINQTVNGLINQFHASLVEKTSGAPSNDLVAVEAALIEHAKPWSPVHPIHHYTPHHHIYPSAAAASAAVTNQSSSASSSPRRHRPSITADSLTAPPKDEKLLSAATATPPSSLLSPSSSSSSFRIDVSEDNDRYILHAELPGIDKSDIDVIVRDGVITITAERKKSAELSGATMMHRSEREHGLLNRSLHLPSNIDAEHGEASFENGVLTIIMKKLKDNPPKKIPIR